MFVVGYPLTFGHFADQAASYLVLNALSFAACLLFLTVCGERIRLILPEVILFAVFIVAYYVKFYVIVLHPEFLAETLLPGIQDAACSEKTLLKAFFSTTLAFISFCTVASFLSFFRRNAKSAAASPRIALSCSMFSLSGLNRLHNFAPAMLLGLILAAMIASGAAMHSTDISLPGLPPNNLPFRMAGAIFYLRQITIPALLILLWALGDVLRSLRYRVAAVALLVLHGVSEVLIRSARGTLATPLIVLGFFLILHERLNLRRVILLSFLLLVPAHFASDVMDYRSILASQPDTRLEGFRFVVRRGRTATASYVPTSGLEFVLTRLTGINSVIPIRGIAKQPLGLSYLRLRILSRAMPVAWYFTHDVYGHADEQQTGRAPSLVGWFYLVGGNSFVVIGVSAYTMLASAVWRMGFWKKLLVAPLARALVLGEIHFSYVCMEGLIDSWPPTAAVAGSILVCEMFVRATARAVRARKTHGVSAHRYAQCTDARLCPS